MDSLRDSWGSLGIAFNFSGILNKNPEEAIIDFIKSGEFPKDRKIYAVVLLWLDKYSELIHVENLKSRMKDLALMEAAILGGIAAKCVKKKDLRWGAILKIALERIEKENVIFPKIDRESFVKFKGEDEDFKQFGLSVAKSDMSDGKKLMTKEHILKNNEWLKNRFLYGCNLRADFITVIKLKLVDNAYQAAKLLRCSIKAAYRNWNDLQEAVALEFLKI